MRGGNTMLPRRVRLREDDRESAAFYLISQAAGFPVDPDELAQGKFNLERLFGLRSGRDGSERDVDELVLPFEDLRIRPSDLAAALTDAPGETLALARRAVELECMWVPALLPVLRDCTPQNVAFLDIADEIAAQTTPEYYAGLFAHHVLHLSQHSTEDEAPDPIPEYEPAMIVAMELGGSPEQQLDLVRSRLRAPQRVQLRAARWALQAQAEPHDS
jgi:hypothetical protein